MRRGQWGPEVFFLIFKNAFLESKVYFDSSFTTSSYNSISNAKLLVPSVPVYFNFFPSMISTVVCVMVTIFMVTDGRSLR